jgi:hypothetical protein
MVTRATADDNATNASDNSSLEVNTAADLAKLRNDGAPLTSQELTASSIGRALKSRGWTKKTIRRIAKARNADLRDL